MLPYGRQKGRVATAGGFDIVLLGLAVAVRLLTTRGGLVTPAPAAGTAAD